MSSQSYAQAQERTISGKVIDAASNEPLIGAEVVIRGTNIGTMVVASDGSFSLTYDLSVVTDPVLETSFLGYQTSKESILGKSVINIILRPSNEMLEELVVVGYGTSKKATLTGAIESVSSDEILTTKTASLAGALAGKIPGLLIMQTDGMPGAFTTTISVRGQGGPMFVIDGVVRNDATEFQKLSPEDIESISVLKDASAAIYGINSSNGVILVTTKKGQEGPVKITYNGNVGVMAPAKHIETLNVEEYWDNIQQLRFLNNTGNKLTPEALAEKKSHEYVDWYAATFKKATVTHNHNVSVSGGNEKLQGYANVGYQKDYGLLRSGDLGYDKYNLRGSLVFTPNKNWKVELGVSGHKDKRYQPGTWNDAFFFIMKMCHGMIPDTPIYVNGDSRYPYMPELGYDNPVVTSQKEYIGYKTWEEALLQTNASVEWSLPWVEGLKLRVKAAYDLKHNNNIAVQKNFDVYRADAEGKPYKAKTMVHNAPNMNDEASLFQRIFWQAMISYDRTFKDAHHVSATLAFEGRSEPYHYLRAQRFYDGSVFTSDMINMIPEDGMVGAGNTNLKRYMSLIGRFNYSYKDKYLVEFAFREDGSYRYHPDSRWGFFPVASVGWRISEEPFVKDNAPWITNIKIRASYGVSAEDAGNPYQYIPAWGYGGGYVMDDSGSFVRGFTPPAFANSKLTWVQSKLADIGLDINLWNGKLGLTLDYYQKDRTGLLANRLSGLPNHVGVSLPQENLNADRNCGFDMVLSHYNEVGEFWYSASFNVFMNRWMPTKVQRAPFRSSYDEWRNKTEGRWGDIGWGYNVLGQFQNLDQIHGEGSVIETTGNWGNFMTYPGDYIHEDVNGNGWIDGGDALPIFWNGKPKVSYGLNIAFGWKGIDFNMLWNGGSNYSVKYSEILAPVNGDANIPKIYADRWRLSDPFDLNSEWIPGKYPASHSTGTSNALESPANRLPGAYARLKSVELGYTLPKAVLAKARISNLRFYVNLLNPLLITNKDLGSFDPELKDGKAFGYPLSRTYSFGLSVSF